MESAVIITLEDLEGVPERLKEDLLSLKDKPLGGPKGGKDNIKWNVYVKALVTLIDQGKITLKS